VKSLRRGAGFASRVVSALSGVSAARAAEAAAASHVHVVPLPDDELDHGAICGRIAWKPDAPEDGYDLARRATGARYASVETAPRETPPRRDLHHTRPCARHLN
jgi:hypothetical protein